MSPRPLEDLEQLVVLWETLTNSRLAQKWRARFLSDPDALQLAALLRSAGRDALVRAGATLVDEILLCRTCSWAFSTRTAGFQWHLCPICRAELGWMSPYRVLRLRNWRVAVEWRVHSRERSAAYAAFLVDSGEEVDLVDADTDELAELDDDVDEWGDSRWPTLSELGFRWTPGSDDDTDSPDPERGTFWY